MKGANVMDATDQNFDALVSESSVPLVVDFWAPWCPPCQMLKPVLKDLAHELAGRAGVVFVNVDEQPGLAARFGVRSIPAVMIVKGGEIVDSWVGYSPRETILARLAKLS